jgi:hypothetical protein
MTRLSRLALALLILATPTRAAVGPDESALSLDFRRPVPGLRLVHGARVVENALEFTDALQYAEIDLGNKLEWTAPIAPRPLWVGQAVGERRPREEANHATVRDVYETLGAGNRVNYVWYAGDRDFPPEARRAALAWFARWFASPSAP